MNKEKGPNRNCANRKLKLPMRDATLKPLKVVKFIAGLIGP